MALTLASAARLLSEYGLLREIIQGDDWTLDAQAVNGFDKPFGSITYDTRQVVSNTLLCCKGRFKAEYLDGIDDRGLAAYVAENDFSATTKAPGLIVNDARKAMSLLSAAFYGYPQDQLKVVGITGTKGKTTTAYLTQAMLNGCSGGKCALFSSVDNCLDGHTYAESDLTTPESMDAFRMMREAADNGMEYLVMEVSSQAYKVDRVFGLTFDVAAFLNISPDHISPIEHPTFEDYFHCKRQIVKNCRSLVLGTACAHADLIRQDAAIADIPITAFALGETSAADVTAWPESADHSRFAIAVEGEQIGSLSLQLDGDFNYANAAAAIAIAHAVGFDFHETTAKETLHNMEPVRIAGRMEHFHDTKSNTIAIVDYAHNYASVTALLDYVDQRYGKDDPEVTLVTGSAGNKAYDRRSEIVRAAQNRINHLILTFEDTDDEPVEHICQDMLGSVTNPDLDARIILDRTEAVESTVVIDRKDPDRLHIILIIGKGNERWFKDHGKHIPFEGDDHIVKRIFGLA